MKPEYRSRIADKILKEKLEAFGAVYIAGPKWCGKTRTAEEQAKSALYLDDPDKKHKYLQTADTLPSRLLKGDKPRLIDEWQLAPVLWDAVRFAVDRSSSFGEYILTGSTTVKKGLTNHTGTGRISRMVMRPMSLFESGESNGEVSLSLLFAGTKKIDSESNLTIEDIAFVLARGGWPVSISQSKEIALRQVYEYVEAIINNDISEVDDIVREPTRVRSLMRSLARNVSTQANFSTLRADMRAEEEELSEDTIASYISALARLFVVDDLNAWSPSIRSKDAIRTSPTRHFVDPSIAAAVLRLDPDGLMDDFETFGLLFESLAIRDLRVYAESIDGEVFHYRDSAGLEADAIIRLKDTRWAGIEVKMGANAVEKAVANLLKLKEKVTKPPSFLMVLTASQYAYTQKDGVHIVPIGCLKP